MKRLANRARRVGQTLQNVVASQTEDREIQASPMQAFCKLFYDLTDALPRNAETLPDLFESFLAGSIKAKKSNNDADVAVAIA